MNEFLSSISVQVKEGDIIEEYSINITRQVIYPEEYRLSVSSQKIYTTI